MAQTKEVGIASEFTVIQNSNIKIVRHNLCGLTAGYFLTDTEEEKISAAKVEHLKVCQEKRTNL